MCKPADTNKLISFSVPISPLGIKARFFCTVSTEHYSQLHTQTLFFLFFFLLPLWLLERPDHLSLQGALVSRLQPRLKVHRELFKDQRTLEILLIINVVGGKAGASGCEGIQGHTTDQQSDILFRSPESKWHVLDSVLILTHNGRPLAKAFHVSTPVNSPMRGFVLVDHTWQVRKRSDIPKIS